MLTCIRLGNFTAFVEAQKLPLKPLTLIFGANSAGESVDLGGFRQYVHRRDTERRVEWSAEIDTAKLTGQLAAMLAPVNRVAVSVEIGLAHEERKERKKTTDPKTGKEIEVEVPSGEMVATGEPGGADLRIAYRKQAGRNMAEVDRILGQKPGTEKQRPYRLKQKRN